MQEIGGNVLRLTIYVLLFSITAPHARAAMTASQCENVAKQLAAYSDLLDLVLASEASLSKDPALNAVGHAANIVALSGELNELYDITSTVKSSCK